MIACAAVEAVASMGAIEGDGSMNVSGKANAADTGPRSCTTSTGTVPTLPSTATAWSSTGASPSFTRLYP
jgi:hypothetical protein